MTMTRTRRRLPLPDRAPVVPQRPAWHDLAACDGTLDPVFFGPGDGEHWAHYEGTGDSASEDDRAREAAQKYCDRCPVRVVCLATALSTGSPGVWAGTSRDHRKALLRSRTRSKCPVCRCETLVTIEQHDMCTACGMSWRTGRPLTNPEHEPTHGDDR